MSKEIKKKSKGSVGYKGQVEIGLIKNGKKYKKVTTNSGKSELFTYICECLAARLNPNIQVDLSNRPGKLRIMSGSTQIVAYDIGLSDVQITPGIGEGPSDVVFSFLVPGTSVYQKSFQDVQLLAMKSDTKSGTILAEAHFKNSITITDIDTNIYVTWTLSIGNGKIE